MEDLTVQVERSSDQETWTTVSPEAVAEGEWQDGEATQGQTWFYRLRSVRQGDVGAPIVGPPGDPIGVDHPDVYPPPAPTDLVCLPEDDRVRLRWATPSRGVTFRIERSVHRGAPEVIASSWERLEFDDVAAPFGPLVYEVRAVDEAGNPSGAIACETLIGAMP
jgi:hypothetical protein